MATPPRARAKTTTAAAAKRSAAVGRSLPPITPARFKELIGLVEQLANGPAVDVFIAAAQGYRARHRSGTDRPLNASEAASFAAGMAQVVASPPIDVAVALQQSELRAYDEPEPMELLLRGGIATAPKFMEVAQRFVALIEMPADDFMAAREAGALDVSLDDAVKAMEYEDMAGAGGVRERSQRAFEHFAASAGVAPGKALSLLPIALWKAIEQAMSHLGLTRQPSSLTGSAPSMDGVGSTSSTASPTPTP